jgi:asparagine synthase (glutamine-hydrolysing)
MADAIAHRGPDDEGFHESTAAGGLLSVGLAHRRLSIIDLSTGHQPIGNEDGSVQIVYNGEIYNYRELRDELIARGHRFATESDTETIVHAYEEYGDECVTRFRGMFAFAIWDKSRERLFLARDRFGKKPLFLHETNGEMVFASEIKSLLCVPGIEKRCDLDAVWDYLSFRYVPGPRTLFTGIRKLPPGHCAVWERRELRQWAYYTPPDGLARMDVEIAQDPAGEFLQRLDEAVRIRMVSDVPFGAFLSGGIDSSAVVGLMARHSSLPVKTFSVGFAESAYSELRYAKTIADRYRTEHHELKVSQKHLMDELPALVRFRDAPVSEPSDIPIYLLSREARKTVKMVLTGEGSDEVLGGYPKHVFERYAALYQCVPFGVRAHLMEPLIRALPYRFRRAKTAILTMGLEDWQERMPRWFGALSNSDRVELVKFRPSASAVARHSSGLSFADSNTALRRILYFDQTSWLPDNLLERGDRMTMAASLEGRMPFLDHELVQYVSSLPDRMRVKGRTRKWLLREAMKRMLPRQILERPKVGFRVPVNEWFRGPMRDYLYDHLSGPASRTAQYYTKEVLDRVLSEHVDAKQNHEKLLWCLLNLEIWHREFDIAT